MEKWECYVKDSLESRLEVSRNIGLYLKSCHSLLCASMYIVSQPLWWHNPMEKYGWGRVVVYKGVWYVVRV